MNIGKELAEKAKKSGICEDWYKELKALEDKEKLLQMYLKGIDFCLSNDFPSNDYIRKNFVGMMEKHGVYLDHDLSSDSQGKVVSLGNCTGFVHVFEFNVCQLFVKHNSELTLIAEDDAFVMVDIFDSAKLKVVTMDHAKICINRYSGDNIIEQECKGDSRIKIIEKHKKTY